VKQQSVVDAPWIAAEGLLFSSESESPMEWFLGEGAGDKLTP
jgi:hypothetical protein